jgi:hypothetical protein
VNQFSILTGARNGKNIALYNEAKGKKNVYFASSRISDSCTIHDILKTLSKLRINPVNDEYDLQRDIALTLISDKFSFYKEKTLGPRNRVDFLVSDNNLVNEGIAIEVKKGKPNKVQVIRQLERYAAFPKVKGIILVVERNLDIPREINGKQCVSFGLNKLWGIAL